MEESDDQGSSSSRKIRVNKSAVYSEFEEISWTCPKTNKIIYGQKCKVPGCNTQIYRNSKFKYEESFIFKTSGCLQ